jgi:hypothetical protein
MRVVRKATRVSAKPRLSLLVSSLALLLLVLSLLAINAFSATTQAKPIKAPAPTVSPQPPARVKGCPAHTRYNPTTRGCEKIRF